MVKILLLVSKILYFFWLKAEKVEVRVEPPAVPAEQAAGLPAKAPLAIQVAADGSAHFEGEKLNLDALEKKLTTRVAQEKDLALIIRADAEIAVDKLFAVMGVCQKAGVLNLAFAINPEAGGKAPLQPRFEEEQD